MGFLVFLCLLSFLICRILSKWNEMRYGRKLGLPPGTMGWPLFGENFQFFGPNGPNFMKKQRKRYGDVFKTHILGCPTIISMDPELNRYILLNEGQQGLVPGYPKSIGDILGQNGISAVSGNAHKNTRGSAMFLVGPSAVKEKLIPRIDKYVKIFLQNWDGKIIELQEKTQEMAFFVSFNHVFGDDESSWVHYREMKQEFDKLVKGTLSLPINLPGSNYRKGIQARKRVIELLKQIIKRRRSSGASTVDHNNDMLDSMLGNHDGSYELSDEEIHDQIIMILNSGYETESTVAMLAIKYLHDHPDALKELMDEHFGIRREKSGDDEPRLSWSDYKRMAFTRAVIFETMRLATVVNGVLRKTTKDVELNGFHIPEGWRIYVFTREINYSEMYPNPFSFNPWRWMQDINLETRKYMFLFGGGGRLCPGKELGIATIAIFLHHFVTNYRWEERGEVTISKFPRVQAPKGFHVRVMRQQ